LVLCHSQLTFADSKDLELAGKVLAKVSVYEEILENADGKLPPEDIEASMPLVAEYYVLRTALVSGL